MYNDRKKEMKSGAKNNPQNISRRGLKNVSTSSVPNAYYNRIQSNGANTKHHVVWEALNDVLVIKGGRVFVR